MFNVQRGFGTQRQCTWPRQNCAHFGPYGNGRPGQGAARRQARATTGPCRQPASRSAASRPSTGGTLIGLGGHLHPGGLSVDIDAVRGARRKRILTSEAIYWDWKKPSKPGGPPTSWDVSMTVTGAPWWGVRLKPGDVAAHQRHVRHAGIRRPTRTWASPSASSRPDKMVNGKVVPDRAGPGSVPEAAAGRQLRRLHAPGGLKARPARLCTRGIVTPRPPGGGGQPRRARRRAVRARCPATPTEVGIAGFLYTARRPVDRGHAGHPHGDQGPARCAFTNLDAFAQHLPLGHLVRVSVHGADRDRVPARQRHVSTGKPIEFDSGTLGYGHPADRPGQERDHAGI